MEKILNENEKFLKAQEIYYRRKAGNLNTVPVHSSAAAINKQPKPKLKKMFIQIIISIIIYIIVYVVQHSNYYFSQDFVKKAQDVLSYNFDFSTIVTSIQGFLQTPNIDIPILIDNENNIINSLEENSTLNNVVENNTILTEPSKEETPTQNISSFNQMKLDSEEINKNYELILPITGNITSPFGIRDVSPVFHTGLDIARNSGTEIVAAMDGKVSLNPEESEYGNHLTITNKDLKTLYAHCSDLLVDDGAWVTKGQAIAKVGSTGNSSGPHLHFEIIYKDRIVDPEYVLDF